MQYEVDFDTDDGRIHAYPAYGGGFFITATNTDKRLNGVSLTDDDLRELAARLKVLADYPTGTPSDLRHPPSNPRHASA